jgi:hypothetical protein
MASKKSIEVYETLLKKGEHKGMIPLCSLNLLVGV